jgi:hypothetical protein
MSDDWIAPIEDRLAVQDAVAQLFIATDEKDWERIDSIFADQGQLDRRPLAPRVPARMGAATIAAAWRKGLESAEVLQHRVDDQVIRVNGDEATAFCYGTATYYTPDGEKKLTYQVGRYDFHLVRDGDGWRIDRFRFDKECVA